MPPSAAPVIAEVVRSGFVECRHRGSVVVLAADGSIAGAAGEVAEPIFPRSANKPLQATAMVRAGLDVPARLLALATASHSGEPFHVDGVRQLLAAAGLDESALRCPPSWPIDEGAMAERIRAGQGRQAVTMNCSGKHAGMLGACVAAGWPTATYLDPDHPLQQLTRRTVEEIAGESVAHVGIDGCGAPLFSLSLSGLARAFRAMVLAEPESPERRVSDAIRTYPERASGTRRDEAALIRAVPGLVAKSGAEGCYAAALADGRAVALKIEDGGQRARPVVMAAVLRRLGVDADVPGLDADVPGVDADVLGEQSTAEVFGGGRPVGEIRAVPENLPDLPGLPGVVGGSAG